MKILFLLSRIEKSGVAIHTLDLAEGLVQRGHELTMITGGITDKDNDYLLGIKRKFDELGVQIKTFKAPQGNILGKAFTSVLSILRIMWWIQRSKADVIHAQSPYMTFLPWIMRKKFVSTVHNVQLVKNIKYKNPTELIAISRESKEYAVDKLGARRESVTVVCHGVSRRYSNVFTSEEKKEFRREQGISDSTIVIGFVGRITIEKGLDVLIEAVEKYLPPHLHKDVACIFLGDYFSEEDERWFVNLMSRSDLSDRIRIVPFQDPYPFYNIFDIFVLPSKSEAFGLVCVEAMMCGCCTVRTDTNGALDQIDHGKDGYIFPNGDAEALAKILQYIMQNPEQISFISANGRKKALEHFTIEAMTEKTLEVYKKVL
ncbi:MAG TPA: glycosyltransferase family 4 protein [Eudoraea sp.]|nr:glycosyltransferase family 4 protein [Eudoraea sp.]